MSRPCGTYTAYLDGCRCARCRRANTEMKRRGRERARAARSELDRARGEHLTIESQMEREAAFLASDVGSGRLLACPHCARTRRLDFTTNGHGVAIAVCYGCGWSALAAATRRAVA